MDPKKWGFDSVAPRGWKVGGFKKGGGFDEDVKVYLTIASLLQYKAPEKDAKCTLHNDAY